MWYECSKHIWKLGNSFETFSLGICKDFISQYDSGQKVCEFDHNSKEGLNFASSCSRQSRSGHKGSELFLMCLKTRHFWRMCLMSLPSLFGVVPATLPLSSEVFDSNLLLVKLCLFAECGNELSVFECPLFPLPPSPPFFFLVKTLLHCV